ncbi:MAG: hypothetical protein V4555_20985, partial [Acidobacteriota bacterium]
MNTERYTKVAGMLALMPVFAGFFAIGTRCVEAQDRGTMVNLPTSKRMFVPVPGEPRRVNSMPMTLAVSPDGKWVVSLNAGFGTFESKYGQS